MFEYTCTILGDRRMDRLLPTWDQHIQCTGMVERDDRSLHHTIFKNTANEKKKNFKMSEQLEESVLK